MPDDGDAGADSSRITSSTFISRSDQSQTRASRNSCSNNGAITDDLTHAPSACSSVRDLYPTTDIRSRSNDENLFSDIVRLVYCTGDLRIRIHAGFIADSALYLLITMPEGVGHNMTLFLTGYTKTKAMFNWIVENLSMQSWLQNLIKNIDHKHL